MKLADLATGSDWIVWIVFAIFAVLSITLLSGRGSWFISGYNTATKEENGIHMKVLSKEKPNENCVPDNDITLEDAYIYLTNNRE